MRQEIAIQETQLQEITSKTNNVLQQNISSAEKAVEFGNQLLNKLSTTAMSEELDKECNDFLVKVKKTLTLMNERRVPITQLFDQVKKHFTLQESLLDPKGDVYVKVQTYRNNYASEKAREKVRQEAEAKRKLDVAKEKTSILETMTVNLNAVFYLFLNLVLEEIQTAFNSITLEKYFEGAQSIAAVSKVYPRQAFDSFNHQIRAVYLTPEEVEEIKVSLLSDDTYKKYAANFETEVEKIKEDILEKLPAKKEELEEIAKAEKEDAKKAEKLKKDAKEREKKDQERMVSKVAEKETKDNLDASKNKAEADMSNLFDASKSVDASGDAQVRKSLVIDIKHPAAFVQIFQLWFEEEGSKLPIDKLEKKSLGQMKRFCESHATKDGVVIDSPYIEYKEDFKAVAK